jgi:hypothetical protein
MQLQTDDKYKNDFLIVSVDSDNTDILASQVGQHLGFWAPHLLDSYKSVVRYTTHVPSWRLYTTYFHVKVSCMSDSVRLESDLQNYGSNQKGNTTNAAWC